MYLTLILTWSFSTLSFLILVPVKSRTVKLGQRSCKKMAHSVDEFLADWYNMLILWIYVKVHLYFCVGYEAEWRNFHKQSGSDQSFFSFNESRKTRTYIPLSLDWWWRFPTLSLHVLSRESQNFTETYRENSVASFLTAHVLMTDRTTTPITVHI